MNVIILNTNSFGGNYEYSRCLATAYQAHAQVNHCAVLIPVNAAQQANACYKKILISDQSPFTNKIGKRFYFLYRSIVNPIKTFFYLKKALPSLIIVNDYEQISAVFWAPLFRLLQKKHTFVIVLHDPDRDQYLPLRWLSTLTMKRVMSVMDAALYHEQLPDKAYYRTAMPKFCIPHGVYTHSDYDVTIYNQLMRQKGTLKLMGVIGNIRDEKNYSLLIDSLSDLPDVLLVIAGSPANSSVSIAAYKKQIEELHVTDQVIWIEKRLSDAEMQAIIKACDLMLLYYKHSFTSQSGLLNLIAPHKKKLIVSDGPSALTKVVQTYHLGAVVPLDKKSLITAILELIHSDTTNEELEAWDTYVDYASWDNHVRIVMEQIGRMQELKNNL